MRRSWGENGMRNCDARAAEECVQMHGGIGFTWEHPAHLFLKRAKTNAVALGNADRHRQVLGGLVDIRP